MDLQLPVLAPSLLASDFLHLQDDIQACLDSGITWLHCDIMDGHFVPNISYGPAITKSIGEAAPEAFLDVHLMIDQPELYIDAFADAGADMITVHQEATKHLHRLLQQIRDAHVQPGVAINPATPVQTIEPILSDVDLVLVMSVNPGFGGQAFIPETLEKVRTLRAIREEKGLGYLIQIDGGAGIENARTIVEAGTDVLVAGSSVFRSKTHHGNPFDGSGKSHESNVPESRRIIPSNIHELRNAMSG